jgi:hypothetical protein
MSRTIAAFALALALPLATTVAADDKRPRDQGPLRVLFVGNSYTYTHALPVVVSVVAQASGVLVLPGMLAEPDYALEDHIVTGAYDEMLERGWDWVVLQQGPSSLPANREHLRTWSVRAAESARARDIRVALMSAWPALGNAHTWANAEASYRLAADAARACVAPVSTAWRHARERHPEIGLYQRDGLHPEHSGTLLAALVVVRALTGRAPKPGALGLGSTFDDRGWRSAELRATTLSKLAALAVAEATPRCRR